MLRMADISIPSDRLFLIVMFVILTCLNGCAVKKPVTVLEPAPLPGPPLAEEVERNDFSAAAGESVIGRLAVLSLEKGDNLADVARHFGLGLAEISSANPGVDVWVPEDGKRIILPLSFVLPDARRKGIVINLAAMRLFQFKGNGKDISTYPVGIGAEDRPTPMGQMYVKSKTARPTWHVPASIAERYRKKGDPLPDKVPPGPEPPRGIRVVSEQIRLPDPWHQQAGQHRPQGNQRLPQALPGRHKEDLRNTPVNTPVSIVDQPYLVGQSNGVVYLECMQTAKTRTRPNWTRCMQN